MRAVRTARALIYDKAIVGLTAGWYRACSGGWCRVRLLDIGIGTGSALLANAATLAEKRLRSAGSTSTRPTWTVVRRAVGEKGSTASSRRGWNRVRPSRRPLRRGVLQRELHAAPRPAGGAPPRPAPRSRRSHHFTQTFEHTPSRAVETLKPLLRLLTTIDFGRVTYEADFRRALTAGGETIEAFELLNQGPRRSGALAVSRRRSRQRQTTDHTDFSDEWDPSVQSM